MLSVICHFLQTIVVKKLIQSHLQLYILFLTTMHLIAIFNLNKNVFFYSVIRFVFSFLTFRSYLDLKFILLTVLSEKTKKLRFQAAVPNFEDDYSVVTVSANSNIWRMRQVVVYTLVIERCVPPRPRETVKKYFRLPASLYPEHETAVLKYLPA